jgi:superoxide dismutase
VNHELFFNIMTPASLAIGAPTAGSPLAIAIDTAFGSFAHFQTVFTNSANALFGR